MNKRTLMLSAAAVALLSAPAMAVAPIDKVATTAQKTSTLPNPLTIATTGGIKLTSGTTPLLTVDSNAVVDNQGSLSAAGVTSGVAVLIDGTKNTTGSFTNDGTIDLSGVGTGKTALHLSGVGSYTGPISFNTGTVTIAGDQSTGIMMDSGFVLNGTLNLGGTSFLLTPTTANGTASSAIAIAQLLGTINGNVTLGASSTYSATGNSAEGIVVGGHISGTFSNAGRLTVSGVATRSTTVANAESGSALIIENSIDHGFLNDGPVDTTGVPAAAFIFSNGVSNSPTLLINATTNPIVLGKDAADVNTGGNASFINRGTISAQAEDPNQVFTRAIQISGAAATPVTFSGDFFSSGAISAQATNTSTGSSTTVVALEIDSYVAIPNLHFSGQSATAGNGLGSISAADDGVQNALAEAILISPSVAGSTSVPNITIDAGATVSARASVSNPASTAVTSLTAVAIRDLSNTLTTLTNKGTISATATPLTNGVTSVAHAVDVSTNTVGLTFVNNGTVLGDVLFGSGNDTYTIAGTGGGAGQLATHIGAIDFGTGGVDALNVGVFSTVTGTITGTSASLAVDIAKTGTLNVQNIATSFVATTIHVAGDPNPLNAGTLDVTVSQALAANGVVVATTSATFDPGSNLAVHYGSFLPAGGVFTLVSAPTGGGLSVSNADVMRYSSQVGGVALPFLFTSAAITRVNNINASGRDVLQLTVTTKSALDLGLKGYAVQMFPLANAALVGDPTLGAAMIAGINSQAQAQAAYDQFAPDVSGGTRAVAISLTDQATGVVAARQRQLRLFAKEPGELTLWGNEFGEYISTHGQNLHGLVDGAAGVVSPTLPAGTVCAAGGCPTVTLPGFKDHGFGFALGLDTGAPDIGWYGAALSFYTGDIVGGGDTLSKTHSLWYMLTGYTDWRGRGLFFDSQVTVGVGQLKGKRTLDLTLPATATTAASQFIREADSKRAALVGALGFTTGAVLKFGSTFITPQLAVDGMSMREEGFTELNGGNGFNLAVKPYYANSLRAFLGTELRQNLDFGDFFIQPSARVGYRFDFLNNPVKLRAAFADIDPTQPGNQPGASFTIQGPDPGRGNFVGGLNLNATTDNWTIGLSYDFVRGANNATEQVGTFSLLGRI